jgi:hypothetical protein
MAMTKKNSNFKKELKLKPSAYLEKKIKTKPKLVHFNISRIGAKCPPYN